MTLYLSGAIICGITLQGASYVYNRVQEYKIIDQYPEKMKETVKNVKNNINSIYFELLTKEKTNVMCFEKGWIAKGNGKSILQEDLDEFCHRGVINNGVTFNGYIVNNQFSNVYKETANLAGRVTNAKKMRAVIKTHGLKMIVVPKKYCCSYPDHLKDSFGNKRYFVLAEECANINKGKDNFQISLKELTEGEIKQIGKELIIFFRHSGIVDFHFGNFYIRDKKVVLFDTEPMKLTLSTFLSSVSPTLTEINVNYENAFRRFQDIKEAEPIIKKLRKAQKQVQVQEFSILSGQITAVALFVFGTYCSFLV